jgi:hypothetical protein
MGEESFMSGKKSCFLHFDVSGSNVGRSSRPAGANNGGLVLSIDGVQSQLLSGIDRVLLGALAGIDTGTRGTYYFDAIESQREANSNPLFRRIKHD